MGSWSDSPQTELLASFVRDPRWMRTVRGKMISPLIFQLGRFSSLWDTLTWMVVGERENGENGRIVQVKYRLICCLAYWVVYITIK